MPSKLTWVQVTTTEVLNAMVDEMRRRAKAGGGRDQHPRVVVVVDEALLGDPEAAAQVELLAREGRRTGVVVSVEG